MFTGSKTKKIVTGGIVAIVLILFTIKFFFIDYFQIPQNGMYPGMPAGSGLFMNRRAYSDASGVKRGDIVVFLREENGHRYNYIWRVVALPGDKVEASGELLTLNGKLVERQRLREEDGRTIYQEKIGDVTYEVAFDKSPKYPAPDAQVTVPPDQFFVLGDNRYNAVDSRYFGPISFSAILGKKL